MGPSWIAISGGLQVAEPIRRIWFHAIDLQPRSGKGTDVADSEGYGVLAAHTTVSEGIGK
jgi:hypothetical protein